MPRCTRSPYKIASFNKDSLFNPHRALHWGSFFSTDTLYSIAPTATMLGTLYSSYRNHAMFSKSVGYFEGMEEAARLKLQHDYLNLINHDQYATIYPAFMTQKEHDDIGTQARLIIEAAWCFAKELCHHKGQAPTLMNYLDEARPQWTGVAKSILETSLCNYSLFHDEPRLPATLRAPHYSECGIDIMMSAQGPVFAELQYSYQSYPHHIDTLTDGLHQLSLELVQPQHYSDFCNKRVMMMKDYVASLAQHYGLAAHQVRSMVLDAWVMTQHPTRNYKVLAQQLGATYALFDEFDADHNLYQEFVSEADLCFIFNQPLLFLMDEHPHFGSIIHERMESYPDHRVSGLYEDVMNQKTFLANSPIIDILNDKAIYALLPAITQSYMGTPLKLPVSTPHPLWDMRNPLMPNMHMLDHIKAHKNHYVLCHRLLEAGDGVRIGTRMSQVEWDGFIKHYVMTKPYLFVARDMITMSPDVSLRYYGCSVHEAHRSHTLISDVALGRVSPQHSVASESFFFMCLQH